MSMPTLTILSKPACVQCRGQERYMDGKGLVPNETRDMSQDPDALELARSLGHLQAPVGIVRDAQGNVIYSWAGFNPGRIDEFIALREAAAVPAGTLITV